jgi:tetratricopeptide (TPR) repeat protein
MNPEQRFHQAHLYYQQGRMAEAAQLLEGLRRQFPRQAQILELAAVVALQSGRPDIAAERWAEQVRIEKKNPVAHSNLSMALHALGRLDEAFDHARRAVRLDPKLAQAHNNLGNVYNAGNRLDKARESYEKALRLGLREPRVLVNLGDVCHRTGDDVAARKYLEDSIRSFPDFAPAHNNLGVVLMELGDPEAAQRAFDKAIALQPDDPDAVINLATLHGRRGDKEAAEALLQRALKAHPKHHGALVNLARLRDSQGQVAEAQGLLREVLAMRPDDADALTLLGQMQVDYQGYADAEELFVKAVKSDPLKVKAHTGLAECLLERGRLEVARKHLDKARALLPDSDEVAYVSNRIQYELGHVDAAVQGWRDFIARHPALRFGYTGLADLLAKEGRLEDARQVYREGEAAGVDSAPFFHKWSLFEENANNLEAAHELAKKVAERNPGYLGEAVLRARLLRRAKDYQGAYEALREARLDEVASLVSKAGYLFELGSVCDKLKRYDEAFTAYNEANRLKFQRHGQGYDAARDLQRQEDIRLAYSEENWHKRLKALAVTTPVAGSQPIFILGFPRSGTSLLEQILGSHKDIQPLGELIGIADIFSGKAAKRVLGKAIQGIDLLKGDDDTVRQRLQAMRDYYLSRAAEIPGYDAATPWFTDKMPHNSMHIGLIRLLFPDAPVIRILRHPLDCCLSAYFSNFSTGHSYTSSYPSTVTHFRNVMETFEAFRAFAGEGIAEVRYEDLVADRETEVRRLLEFAGLPWDDACLHHEKSTRVVRTASYEQVTNKIYSSSVFRYRNYFSHIRDAVPIVEDLVERYGYPAIEEGVEQPEGAKGVSE